MAKTPAIFVDRDDTLMVDVRYCRDPAQVKLMPRASEGLRILAQAGFTIIVVTNQSGIGRGFFTEAQLGGVNARLREELRRQGADYHALYYCPHRPEENCSCRKPRPGLLLRAASELDLDLPASFTIGNSDWDVQAGKAAGTRTVLLRNGTQLVSYERGLVEADIIADNLLSAAKEILGELGRLKREED